MGKISLITKEQQSILDEVKQNDSLTSQFYFTGGTALSVVYFQHRYSEDLDFFSSTKFEQQQVFAYIEEWSKNHHFTFTARFVEVVYIFHLTFPNKIPLKVDFGYYPYKRVEKGTKIDALEVDSLTDIAVNKLFTISQRSEVKDFVDLYFLLQKFSLWDLVYGVKVKFNISIEPFLLSADLLKVEDFDYLPKMIKPLTLKTLKEFFREKAKEIGRKSIE